MKKYGFVDGIAGLLMVAIALFVFVATIPTVGTSTVAVVGNGSGIPGYGNANVTGASSSLTTLFPLIFVITVLVRFAGFI